MAHRSRPREDPRRRYASSHTALVIHRSTDTQIRLCLYFLFHRQVEVDKKVGVKREKRTL